MMIPTSRIFRHGEKRLLPKLLPKIRVLQLKEGTE